MIYLPYGLLGLVLIAADIWAKYSVRTGMRVFESIPLLPDVFHLTYVQNNGAAFSLFAGRQPVLIGITSLMLLGVLFYVFWKKPRQPLLLVSLALILAGGVGNLIDRINFGYVVDFFDFRLINFAIFNTADIWVVCGTILLSVYLLFFDKQNEG